jgi:quinol monooxygenase YgiN
MPILRIEHEVPSYEAWKKAFQSDPLSRKNAGVKRYRIYRPLNEPEMVIIELDFENIEQLQATFQALQNLWNKLRETIMINPKTRIIEMVESKEV